MARYHFAFNLPLYIVLSLLYHKGYMYGDISICTIIVRESKNHIILYEIASIASTAVYDDMNMAMI